ncbi:ferrous iron transport protein B [Clostridium manihotivorum]|uniref:Ferrous iron transport protein B n=1 Tax=Clostridium manihotivorum TaxID=2320868 RepID=A0A3R5UAR2_9CLOT|nr:ferrous iron transport protein B [Clostridium manihotivorum]QAA33864.1 ferrous iron transport protein B [Clostridium manihotivorum]
MTTVALLGNPNVGKTTLFNALTGSNQYVGNWPGVTVEKKEGKLNNIKIVDLPGIYAMDTFSNEEKVSKTFLENENVDLIINIVDASNLDRNLYLTLQLKQFKKPIVLLLNMIDVAEKKGFKIDYKALEEELKVKVIPMVASKKKGIDQVKKMLVNNELSLTVDDNDYYFNSEKEAYSYIDGIIASSRAKNDKGNISLTDKIDRFLLHPILAYPIFILIMAFIFQFTFAWVGQPLQDLLDGLLNDNLIPFLSNLLSGTAPWFQSLIVDGIVAGVGGIITFLSIIMSLFLCVSVLEDSGYMARSAFIMDSLMRKAGLSGKAFIPMLMGFGCNVPAIMSARTLESEKDRKLTALLIPLMSCNARLPIYAVFAPIFFGSKAGLVVGGLYFLGIVVAFLVGMLFKNTLFKKDEEPFIIELPEYKMPEVRTVLKNTWDKGKGFLAKAGTIIFAMTVLIWLLQSFNFSGKVDDINQSFLFNIGNFLAPIFAPLGFGNWQASVSLLTGILAKETVVSTMTVIYGGNLDAAIASGFTTASALGFMVFVLLYTSCVTALGTMKKEYGGKMAAFSASYQFVLAWIGAFLIFTVGKLIF